MIASYRVQLSPSFGFEDVARLVPYFRRLGVSHLYLSPITEAREGSVHGYDVIDHNKIRDELGGATEFQKLLEAVRQAGLAIILDFVPNHSGVGARNARWQDVLAYGPHSIHAKLFDIDWDPLKPELEAKLLLPFLGATYGEVIDRGEIKLANRNGTLVATYYDNSFALSPATYGAILGEALPRYERTEVYWDLKDLVEAYKTVAPEEREKAEALRPRLVAMASRVDLDAVLGSFSGKTLHELLERQFWRLSYWKTAGYEINYRRFFDINELVALRMEDADVFWDAHRLLGELLAQEGVAGVRIDHIDGLADPAGYLKRLKDLGAHCIWVEKILAPGEELPPSWPVQGTTGYEMMGDVLRVLVSPDGEDDLDHAYRAALGDPAPWKEEVWRSKRMVLETTLTGELFRLAYGLDRLSESDYHTRDFTLEALREALAEVVAAFPRYRTYLPEERDEAEKVIREAIAAAKRRNPAFEPTVYEFIARILLGEVTPELEAERAEWVRRFQQYTAPLAAKGVEDTAFYRHLRLVALNDVGADPDQLSISVEELHAKAMKRAERYPKTLLATGTHDHKRGEDVRARLAVLSELGPEWLKVSAELLRIGERYAKGDRPSRGDRYLFFQTLVALWGTDDKERLVERLVAYMSKAAHEAKLHTSWLNPDPEYDQALEHFIRSAMNDPETDRVITPLAKEIARHGFANGLSQTLLKLTSPGVPDFYIGAELFDLTLVDPDNRKPVDFALRGRLLEEITPLLSRPKAEDFRKLIHAQDARAKLYLIARVLSERAKNAEPFSGKYTPLIVEGTRARHLIAFAREGTSSAVIALVPRFPATFERGDGWRDTRVILPVHLQDHRWREALGGWTGKIGATLKPDVGGLPWGLLVREP
jgi:(1->4)-alpha-D-glucan 1-alpha-D-glucosylmutase